MKILKTTYLGSALLLAAALSSCQNDFDDPGLQVPEATWQANTTIAELKEQGINVGLVRPITVWPFPYDAVKKAAELPGVKAVLDVELNEGQMLEDVKIAINGAKPIDFFGHLGSQMPTTDEIVAKIISMKEGK